MTSTVDIVEMEQVVHSGCDYCRSQERIGDKSSVGSTALPNLRTWHSHLGFRADQSLTAFGHQFPNLGMGWRVPL
jgi:hypothetical protein